MPRKQKFNFPSAIKFDSIKLQREIKINNQPVRDIKKTKPRIHEFKVLHKGQRAF